MLVTNILRHFHDLLIVLPVATINRLMFMKRKMFALKVALALQRLNAFSQTRKTRALILSGDFNTPPSYPTYEFIKQGRITGDMKKSYESKTPLQKLKPVSIDTIIEKYIYLFDR